MTDLLYYVHFINPLITFASGTRINSMKIFRYIMLISLLISPAASANGQSKVYVYNRDVEVAFANGVNAYYEGDYETAIAELGRVIHEEPDRAYAYYYRGMTFKLMGALKFAIPEFNKAIELLPRIPNAQSELAETYKLIGNVPAALEEYDEMLRKFSDKQKILRDRGMLYEETGDTTRALHDYKRAGANFKALNLYWKKKEYISVIEQLTSLISSLEADTGKFFVPSYHDLLYKRGMASYELGLLDDAMYDLKMSINKNPDFADAYYLRGIIYYQKGLYGNASADFKRTLKIEPDNFEASKYLVHSKNRMKSRR